MKVSKRKSFLDWIATIVLTLYCLIAVFLIGNLILSSVKTQTDLVYNTFGFPKSFTLANYHKVFIEDGFIRYFYNSIVITSFSILSLLFFSSMTAYGIARYKFRGKNVVEMYFLLGLMFPIQIAILPIFIILRNMHLINTFLGMIILYTANMSFPVFIFSQFFRNLPAALYESAIIDGAGEFRIFRQIMMPLSKPVIFTVALISFVQIWNDFYLPLVFLSKKTVRTVTLGIYHYLSNFLAYWNYVFAAATAALVPIIIIFFIFSDQIISGLVSGSIKE